MKSELYSTCTFVFVAHVCVYLCLPRLAKSLCSVHSSWSSVSDPLSVLVSVLLLHAGVFGIVVARGVVGPAVKGLVLKPCAMKLLVEGAKEANLPVGTGAVRLPVEGLKEVWVSVGPRVTRLSVERIKEAKLSVVGASQSSDISRGGVKGEAPCGAWSGNASCGGA